MDTMETLRIEEEFNDFLEFNGIERNEESFKKCSEWLDTYIKNQKLCRRQS